MQRWFKYLFYMVLVLVLTLSLLPLDDDFVTTGWDKTNHLLAFFVLAALYDNCYHSVNPSYLKYFALLMFGVLIEVLQSFTGYRFFSLLDILADALGLLLFYPFRVYWQSLLSCCELRLSRWRL